MLPIGIVTDKDFRKYLATGLRKPDDNIMTIASSPVATCSKNTLVTQAQLQMIESEINHIVITQDGTSQSKVLGILSSKDLLKIYQDSPSELFKTIKRAQTYDDLKNVHQKLIEFCKSKSKELEKFKESLPIFAMLQKTLIYHIIDMVVNEMDSPSPCDFSFFMVGSQGRYEQMLLTDQDNGLVYAIDSPENKTYFLELADKIVHKLNDFGYEFCPALMMANQSQWCLSIAQWQKIYENWILSPTEESVLMGQIYFDITCAYGSQDLINSLQNSIVNLLNKNTLFIAYLGNEAINTPPPLGFFKNFNLEKDFPNEGMFDLKKRVLMPLIDIARLLMIDQKVLAINNTKQRYELILQKEPENAALYHQAIEAFVYILFLRTQTGFLQNNSGRFMNMDALDKTNKLKLKSVFKVIDELKQLITNRFQLNYLG